ncbi:MAG: hypothetical protein Q8R44_11825 [Novosphingobium sp.]|nr:hypothetical protein [Novosphingobium sp.]
MTLMNGLVHGGKGYLWSDTALFDRATGQFRGHLPKAFTGTLWPWAAAISGLYDLNDPHRVARAIGGALPFDTPALLKAAVAALRDELKAGLPCRLLVAVPCTDYGARLYFIAADETGLTPPFVPLELVEFTSSGNGSQRYAEIDALGFTPARMLEFIDHQYASPTDTVQGWSGCTIGGDAIEVEVSAAGVTSRVVREWGDRVGERIERKANALASRFAKEPSSFPRSESGNQPPNLSPLRRGFFGSSPDAIRLSTVRR